MIPARSFKHCDKARARAWVGAKRPPGGRVGRWPGRWPVRDGETLCRVVLDLQRDRGLSAPRRLGPTPPEDIFKQKNGRGGVGDT